jgi:hypothetical protein
MPATWSWVGSAASFSRTIVWSAEFWSSRAFDLEFDLVLQRKRLLDFGDPPAGAPGERQPHEAQDVEEMRGRAREPATRSRAREGLLFMRVFWHICQAALREATIEFVSRFSEGERARV